MSYFMTPKRQTIEIPNDQTKDTSEKYLFDIFLTNNITFFML